MRGGGWGWQRATQVHTMHRPTPAGLAQAAVHQPLQEVRAGRCSGGGTGGPGGRACAGAAAARRRRRRRSAAAGSHAAAAAAGAGPAAAAHAGRQRAAAHGTQPASNCARSGGGRRRRRAGAGGGAGLGPGGQPGRDCLPRGLAVPQVGFSPRGLGGWAAPRPCACHCRCCRRACWGLAPHSLLHPLASCRPCPARARARACACRGACAVCCLLAAASCCWLAHPFGASRYPPHARRGAYAECYALTAAALERDPFATGCLPVHLASALELRKKSELFLRGHKCAPAAAGCLPVPPPACAATCLCRCHCCCHPRRCRCCLRFPALLLPLPPSALRAPALLG